MAEIINPDIGGTEIEIPGGINPDTGTITGPSIQSEINSINEAKENLAQSLINKFGVQGQDILDGNGNVVTSGLANSDGSLKRIASWSLVVNNTSLYWADQLISNTANTETTPQFARIGLGVEPESNYSISTNDPIKILDNGKLLELAGNFGASDIYIQYNSKDTLKSSMCLFYLVVHCVVFIYITIRPQFFSYVFCTNTFQCCHSIII